MWLDGLDAVTLDGGIFPIAVLGDAARHRMHVTQRYTPDRRSYARDSVPVAKRPQSELHSAVQGSPMAGVDDESGET